MGRVMNRIKLTNNTDLDLARDGRLALDAVRSVELDALVDTGAVELALPEDVVRALGLPSIGELVVRDALGRRVKVLRASSLYFEMLGRSMTCSTLVLPVGAQPLIGQVQLEALDLIVDPRAQEVRVNPEHPDAPLLDLMACG
jgi:clan AA aspartic protease